MANRFSFRAWHRDKKEWIHQEPCSLLGEYILLGEWMRGVPIEELNDVVLMQSTGLTDKNGVEIFEGDVLTQSGYPHWRDGEPNYRSVVEWCFAGFHTVLVAVHPQIRGIADGINAPLEEGDSWEVIGNTYENPELCQQTTANVAEEEGKQMQVKEFIECCNKDCNSKMRFDPGDQQYTCGSCDATLAKIVTPNEEIKIDEKA